MGTNLFVSSRCASMHVSSSPDKETKQLVAGNVHLVGDKLVTSYFSRSPVAV